MLHSCNRGFRWIRSLCSLSHSTRHSYNPLNGSTTAQVPDPWTRQLPRRIQFQTSAVSLGQANILTDECALWLCVRVTWLPRRLVHKRVKSEQPFIWAVALAEDASSSASAAVSRRYPGGVIKGYPGGSWDHGRPLQRNLGCWAMMRYPGTYQ